MTFADADKHRLLAVLARQPVDRVPLYEHMISGRYIRHALGLEAAGTSNLAPADHLRLMERIGMDVATFGYKWQVGGLDSWEKLRAVREPSFDWLIDKVRAYRRVLRAGPVGLCVYVHGPLDVTYLSMGYEKFFLAVHDDVELVAGVMDLFTDHTVRVVEALAAGGVDMIYVADDVAFGQGTMVQPAMFRELWLPRMRRIVEPIHARRLPCVYHSDGRMDDVLPLVIELGFHGITPIEAQYNDIFALKRRYGERITLFGNMDIAGSLGFGTPADVERDMRRLLEGMMPGGGYVAMSGNSVSDGVIPENYDAMVRTVKTFGRYE